jgi:hypothetical protein
MATLKEKALSYEPPKTRVISDLDHVSADAEVKTFEGTDFSYDYVEVEGEKYRVPGIVQKHMKAQLEADPSIKEFRVLKEGEGMRTSYTVMPVKQ